MVLTTALVLVAMQPQATPTLKVTIKSATLRAVTGVVEVDLPDGWHAYQNPPKSQYETPLKLESKTKGFKISSVAYPKGLPMVSSGSETLVYEGVVSLPFKAELAKNLKPSKGKFSANLSVSYQICNDSSCLPPASTSIALSWKAAAK
jgi:thioredoxin:protein disulfide reductase